MVLNEEQRIKELREKRIAYGISQGRLAVASGITREYFNKIESGKMKPSKELLETLHKELARFNPEVPLTMLFDYVKIRFPTEPLLEPPELPFAPPPPLLEDALLDL